jgi:putative heme-binding domain-containing protein
VEQLRNIRTGWNASDREKFFSWFLQPNDAQAHPPELLRYFREAGRKYVDGAWCNRYLRDFRRQAASTLSAEERAALQPLLARPVAQAQAVPAHERPFVREWKMADLASDLEQPRKTSLERGRQALADAQCLSCHRFGNDGGVAGPELTGAGAKYSARDLLESILEPSKVLSDQYQNHTVFLKDGDSVSGRLISDSDKEVVLETDRLSGVVEKVSREKVAELRASPLSPMPRGLANVLTKDEILDLIAYLRSGVIGAK